MGLFEWLKPCLATCANRSKETCGGEESRKPAEKQARQSQDFYLNILDDAPVLVWRSGSGGQCDWFNSVWLRFTGRSMDQEVGEGWTEGVHPSDLDSCLHTYHDAFDARRPFEMEYRLRHHDGDYRWIVDFGKPLKDMEGGFAGFIGYCFDITERKKSAEQIHYLAYFDTTTGLPNRSLLQGRFSQALALADRNGNELALMFLDLDNFKAINDTHGHSVGDQVLSAVAKRLASCVHETDTVSRLGGDEFVIILPETGAAGASFLAEKVQNALMAPHHVNGHKLSVGASIGISIFPQDGRDFEALINHADSAMYQVKDAGRGSYQFFSSPVNGTV